MTTFYSRYFPAPFAKRFRKQQKIALNRRKKPPWVHFRTVIRKQRTTSRSSSATFSNEQNVSSPLFLSIYYIKMRHAWNYWVLVQLFAMPRATCTAISPQNYLYTGTANTNSEPLRYQHLSGKGCTKKSPFRFSVTESSKTKQTSQEVW